MSVAGALRIESIEAIPVRVPRREELLPRTAHGEVRASEYVLLRLRTGDGTIGLGEVSCEPRWNGEEWAGTTSLVRGRLEGLLAGADLHSWARIAEPLDAAVRNRPFLRAGLEMACLDALGRSAGLPVAALLGGARRDEIPVRIVLPARDPETVRSMAATARERGARALKVKVGLQPGEDVDRVAAVRELVGADLPITVDANEGWAPADAAPAIRELAEHGALAVEQPIARQAWREMCDLRARVPIPTIGDESIWTADDALRAAQTGAFDVLSVYPGKCGGMGRCIEIARIAESHGLAVALGSNLELGVGAAAMAHAAAALPALSARVPADLIGPLYFEHPLVTDASFAGWQAARLPAGPGLGVQLDEDAVEAHRIRESL